MRLSNNLLRVHLSGFEKAVVALRAAGGQSRLHEEIVALFTQNVQAAGDDNLALAVRTAMQQIAAAVPELPAQQASKYQNWLLTRYRQNWANQTEADAPQPLLLEDLYKYAEDLTFYHNTPNVIKKRAGISTDLFTIDSPFELYQQLKALRGEVATEFKPLSPSQQAFIDSNQAIVIGQTAQWRLVMPLTIAASQEFGAGTRWCTAAQKDNRFYHYFPDNALLYLEASGIGKHAFVFKNGTITDLFDAEDTKQTAAQQQALLDKLPTLATQLQKLDEAVPLLRLIVDRANFTIALNSVIATRNLAPNKSVDEAVLLEKMSRSNLTQVEKDNCLLNAASGGLLQIIEALIKQGADINFGKGLALAASNAHAEAVTLLLEHGADVHAHNDYALRWAAERGHADVVKLLLEHGADVHADNDHALRLAATFGRADVVSLLFDHGADVHAKDDYALCFAATYGHTKVVKQLLEHGGDVHAQNDYALRWAAHHGHLEVVKFLLDCGANVHADKHFALHGAVERGHTDMVKLLLEHGADIHAKNDHALRWAVRNGHTKVVKLLLEHGANVHANNDYALRWAARNGHTKVVKLLLEHCANVHADNDYAMDWAIGNGHTEVVKILEAQITKEAAAQTLSPQRPVASPVAGAIMGNGQQLNH